MNPNENFLLLLFMVLKSSGIFFFISKDHRGCTQLTFAVSSHRKVEENIEAKLKLY
jgi:hypothetical protein